jgi:outer membrane protein OmpA-like peptidoglycan-associated protein
MDDLARLLKEEPGIKLLRVECHTDNVGVEKFNEELSIGRAAAVVNALVERGIARERLASAGYGGHKPLFPNDTADHRAKNRRCELIAGSL